MKINDMFFKIKIILCVMATLILISSTGWATTYYVSNNGNDSSSGTSNSSPWKTMSKVNSRSFSPGDKILFERGDTWTETLNNSSSGTSGNYITYGAYGTGNKPRIDLNTPGLDDGILFDGGEDYVIVENFEIIGDRNNTSYPACVNIRNGCTYIIVQDCILRDCGYYQAIGAGFDYGSGVFMQACSNITVRRCKISNNGIHGVSIWQNSGTTMNNIIIEENEIFDNHHTVGIDIQSDGSSSGDINNVTIRNNLVYDTQTVDDDPGMYVDGGGGCYITNLRIYGNMFYDIYGYCMSFDKAVSSVHIYNNVFYDNSGTYQVWYTSGVDYGYVENNIFMDAGNYFLRVDDTSHVTVDYNCYYRAGGGGNLNSIGGTSYSYSNWSGYTARGYDSNGFRDNPDFTNVGNHDFTLTSSSPCIDEGVNLGTTFNNRLDPASSWPENVLYLDQDLCGSGWEIGAYVFPEGNGPDTQPPATPNGVSIIILNDEES